MEYTYRTTEALIPRESEGESLAPPKDGLPWELVPPLVPSRADRVGQYGLATWRGPVSVLKARRELAKARRELKELQEVTIHLMDDLQSAIKKGMADGDNEYGMVKKIKEAMTPYKEVSDRLRAKS